MTNRRQKNIEWKTPRKIFLVFFFLMLVLFGRYCYLALSPTINGRNMQVFASNRNTVSTVLKAKRGTIYDMSGNVLAQTVTSYTLIAYLDESRSTDAQTNHVKDIDATAKALAPVLETDEQSLMIQAWDEFRIGTGIKVIGFPIWINCFGVGVEDTEVLKGSLRYDEMPNWKKRFVDKNREFYLAHKDFIDPWIKRYDMFNRIKLYQKFEWNCGEDVKNMHDGIIQIRQSGIRVKRSTYFPSLVAIVNTPIIWDSHMKAYRHITPREAANLQKFDQRYKFIGTDKQIYRQLGNSVNVRVLKILCKGLFELRLKDDVHIENTEIDD